MQESIENKISQIKINHFNSNHIDCFTALAMQGAIDFPIKKGNFCLQKNTFGRTTVRRQKTYYTGKKRFYQILFL